MQLVLYLVVLVAAGQAAGLVHGPRLSRASRAASTGCSGWLERGLYRLAGVDPDGEMTWRQYAVAMLLFNVLGLLAVYGLQRTAAPAAAQSGRPCRRSRPIRRSTRPSASPRNTNWQGYGGETTMSYLTQMLGLTVQNFVSAATGMAVLVALIRGFTRTQVEHDRQLLGRSDARARSTSCCRCRWCWRWCWCRRAWCRRFKPYDTVDAASSRRPMPTAKPVTEQTIAAGPGRVADRDQAARHQRRRVLQRQLGASVRESRRRSRTSWSCWRSC